MCSAALAENSLHIAAGGQERLAGVAQARGVVDEQPRRFQLGGRVRELELHALKVGDRLAELLPLLRVRDGVIERALREADHLRADADAPFVERFDRDLVAAAHFAQHVRARHAAVFQQQLARAAGANAELVLLLSDREPGEAALDEKRGDAAIAGVGIDGRKDDEQVRFVGVGDPELAAGQQEIAARFHGARRERERVAARAGLRQRVGADGSRGKLRQILRLLCRASPSAAAR